MEAARHYEPGFSKSRLVASGGRSTELFDTGMPCGVADGRMLMVPPSAACGALGQISFSTACEECVLWRLGVVIRHVLASAILRTAAETALYALVSCGNRQRS